jgi:CheY-like chemotaxis protein
MMPRVDGFGVIEYLRSHEEREAKPMVFIVTAYADHRFKQVDSSVVAGIIHKPFDVAEVGSLVRQCVLPGDSERSDTADPPEPVERTPKLPVGGRDPRQH